MTRASRAEDSAPRDDEPSVAELIELVYERLKRAAALAMARERRHHTLSPTAVVHEVFLKLAPQELASFKSESHFLAVASEAMGRVLMNYAEQNRALVRGGGCKPAQLDTAALQLDGPASAVLAMDLIAVNDAIAKLERLHARQARVVRLRFFGGFAATRIAEELGVSTRTVEGDWATARAWLSAELRK